MRVRRLVLENYRGFEHLDLPFDAENGITVLIGENGSGKSSVLAGLALLFSELRGFPDQTERIFARESRAGSALMACKLEVDLEDRLCLVELTASGRSFDSRAESEAVAAWGRVRPIALLYPPHRRLVSGDPDLVTWVVSRGVELGLDPDASIDFRDLLEWWREHEDRENEIRLNDDAAHREPALQVVRDALDAFVSRLPGADFSRVRFTRVGVNVPKSGVLVLEKRETTLRADQLSDGEATLLLMVADIARQLTLRAGAAESAREYPGVVLIDEIDLHLHPKWQRAVLPALRAAFPNVQFIATTHSPQVLGNLPRESVVILEDFRRVEDTPHTWGRDSTAILADLMGLPERTEEAQALIDEVARRIDAEDFDGARETLRELEARVGPYDSAVVQSRATIAFLEDDEEHLQGA